MAVRLCEAGLGMTLEEVIWDWQHRRIPILEQRSSAAGPVPTLTGTDLELFVTAINRDRLSVCSWLVGRMADLRAGGQDREGEALPPLPDLDPLQLVPLLVGDYPPLQFGVSYPPPKGGVTARDILRAGGVLTPGDLHAYLGTLRDKRGRQPVKIARLSECVSSWFGRVTLGNVLEVDREDGTLLALFWEVCRYVEWYTHLLPYGPVPSGDSTTCCPKTGEDQVLVDVLVSLCRWHELRWWGDSTWIADLRRDLAPHFC
jgi:hypothetical protein